MQPALRLAAVAGGACVAYANYDKPAAVGVLLAAYALGWLPPVFPALYHLYTTKAVGFRIRHMLHPRSAPHSTTTAAARVIAAAAGGAAGVAVLPVPVLPDNYASLIVCTRTGRCAVVDPADPGRIVSTIHQLNQRLASAAGGGSRAANIDAPLRLTHILTTHKHWDHAGGNEELLVMAAAARGGDAAIEVVGSSVDRPAGTTRFVDSGDVVVVGDARIHVHAAPGHTKGSIVFVAQHTPAADDGSAPAVALPAFAAALDTVRWLHYHEPVEPGQPQPALPRSMTDKRGGGGTAVPVAVGKVALFTGDCLFCGGCGAMFESSPADVLRTYDTLHGLAGSYAAAAGGPPLAADDVLVYVGHEYSQRLYAELAERLAKNGSNVLTSDRAAAAQRRDIFAARLAAIARATEAHQCTLPSTLAIEAASNPFLTVQRSVLEGLHARGAPASEVESAVYLSTVRR
jgi:hydroxyacylglutathione hydrolase